MSKKKWFTLAVITVTLVSLFLPLAALAAGPESPPRADTPQYQDVPRHYPVDAAAFGQMKAAANAAAAAKGKPGGGGGGGGSTSLTATPSDIAISYTGWNPPDCAIAVGPTAVLVAANEKYAFYDKSHPWKPLVSPTNLQTFFGTSDSVFDPRAIYDQAQDRFVLLAASMNSGAQSSFFWLVVWQGSNLANPYINKISAVTGPVTNPAWADFPGLGMDGQNLYITSNQFSFGDGSFQSARIMVIGKDSVYSSSGSAQDKADFTGLQDPSQDASVVYSFSVQPANQPDAALSSNTTMNFVNAIWPSGSNLVLRSVTSDSSGCNLNPPKSVVVSQYDLPADAPQPGGRAIDTGDTRLLGATQRGSTIYTSNNTKYVDPKLSSSANAYANAQWYEVPVSGGTGTPHAITSSSVAYFYPSVTPGTTGTTAFVGWEVSGSGSTQSASAFRGRDKGVPSIYAGLGVNAYTLNSRWGDYAASAPDPDGSVWVFGEYAATTKTWGTAVEVVTTAVP